MAGALAILLALPAAGRAQNASLDPQAAEKPMEILSEDGMEWRRDENLFIARGDARAIQGGTTLRADELRAHYKEIDGDETRVYRIEALGKVSIKSAQGSVLGDRAVYDLETGSMTVTGDDLRAESKDYVMTARQSLTYDVAGKLATARGDAQLTQGDRRLRADEIRAILADGKGREERRLRQVEAIGGVSIRSGDGDIKAERGIYNLADKTIRFTGPVTISRGKNRISGCGGQVNLETGVSKLSACPGKDGRVRGVFFPQSKTN